MMAIPQKLKDYIDSSRGPLPPITDPDEPLQIDSLAFVRLVAFLETECGVRIEDEELIAENFATLRQLGNLIASKSSAAPTPPAPCPVLPSATPVRLDTFPREG